MTIPTITVYETEYEHDGVPDVPPGVYGLVRQAEGSTISIEETAWCDAHKIQAVFCDHLWELHWPAEADDCKFVVVKLVRGAAE